VSALDVRNLRVRFDTPRGVVQAVEHVSLSIEPGETLALVGESGSGKSVTALALMGLLPRPPAVIETGEVWVDGQNLLTLGEEQLRTLRGDKIAMVFQDPNTSLHPLFTIGWQLAEALQVHREMSEGDVRAACVRALGDVGLADPEHRLDAYPHELSGGTKQRVMIAMALLCEPKVLIADEPTTALDVTIQAQILDLLGLLQERHGTAILLISHDLALVSNVADRVAVMYAGSIVESAPARELFELPTHPYTLGLLESAPSLSAPLDAPLVSIPGAPPDMMQVVTGCAFEPRCAFKVERCKREVPHFLPWRDPRRRQGPVSPTQRRCACFEVERVALSSRRAEPRA
jgi:oligopeptide transport system ATP-binding protein